MHSTQPYLKLSSLKSTPPRREQWEFCNAFNPTQQIKEPVHLGNLKKMLILCEQHLWPEITIPKTCGAPCSHVHAVLTYAFNEYTL